jgi:two-component system, chemotaxis family, chemotaxis protein CheY
MPSVLIVDDEPDIRLLVRYLVEKADWSVAGEASSGEEAVDRWRQLRPDVVVLDQLMPGISGLEVAARILAEAADQPIVLFTHMKDERLVRAAAEIGIRACLSKGNLHGLMPALADQVAGGENR